MIAAGGWLAGAGGAALAAAAELDCVQVGQVMVSRPIVLGPLLGLLFGAPQTGLALGVCCELLSLGDLPVGGKLPLSAAVAVSAAFLLTASPRPIPPELALPVGLAAGQVHRRFETALRSRRKTFCAAAQAGLQRGEEPDLGRWAARAVAEQAAGTLVLLLVCVLAVGPVLHRLWPQAPRSLADGLGLAWSLAPWLGLGAGLQALKVRP